MEGIYFVGGFLDKNSLGKAFRFDISRYLPRHFGEHREHMSTAGSHVASLDGECCASKTCSREKIGWVTYNHRTCLKRPSSFCSHSHAFHAFHALADLAFLAQGARTGQL